MPILALFFALLSISLSDAHASQLWGIVPRGGTHDMGVLFKYQPDQDAYEVLHHFSGVDGKTPNGALTLARDGKLYGVASEGGANNAGVLFSFTPATRTLTVEHHFKVNNGRYPQAKLLEAPNGLLYGVTTHGGRGDKGVIYRFNRNTKGFVALYRLDGSKGANPRGHLTWYQGRIYGLAGNGGQFARGTLFSFAPGDAELTVHHDFDLGNGGTWPFGGLLDGDNGRLYGLTGSGGGYLFEFDPVTDTYTPKVAVQPGGWLYGSLNRARDGRLFGASASGGSYGRGFIFSFDPATDAYSRRTFFVPWGDYGWSPEGTLTQASNGYLYGFAAAGGRNGAGVLFELSVASDTYWPAVQLGGEGGGLPGSASMIEAVVDVPTTGVRSSVCGKERSKYQWLQLDPVPGADGYEVEIYADPAMTDLLDRLDRPRSNIPLASVGVIDWGGTYYLRAKANKAGAFSDYGAPCEIRIMDEPSVLPVTQLRANVIASPVSPYTPLVADWVFGATRFFFEVYDAQGVQRLWEGNGDNRFTLEEVGLPDWDRNYLVRARVAMGPNLGDWGDLVPVQVMPEPLTVPPGMIRSSSCYPWRSIYQRMYAEPVPGASAYLFEIYENGGLVNSVRTSYPNLLLEEIDGVRWWGNYNIRVRPELGPIKGEFGPSCGVSMIGQPLTGLYSERLINRDCGRWLTLADTILAQNGIGVSQYEFVFHDDPDGTSPVATAVSGSRALALSKVAGLEPGASYWVEVRGNIGPFLGPFGALCPIHVEALETAL